MALYFSLVLSILPLHCCPLSSFFFFLLWMCARVWLCGCVPPSMSSYSLSSIITQNISTPISDQSIEIVIKLLVLEQGCSSTRSFEGRVCVCVSFLPSCSSLPLFVSVVGNRNERHLTQIPLFFFFLSHLGDYYVPLFRVPPPLAMHLNWHRQAQQPPRT